MANVSLTFLSTPVDKLQKRFAIQLVFSKLSVNYVCNSAEAEFVLLKENDLCVLVEFYVLSNKLKIVAYFSEFKTSKNH